MSNEIIEKHEKLCNERIEEMKDFLGDGECPDWDEYKKVTGKIFGVRMSLDIMNDIVKGYETEEGEEDGT